MAKLIEADSRGIQRGPIGSAPRLPPRIPSIPGRGVSPSDLGSGMHSNQSYESIGQSQRQHKRTPSCNMVMQEQPLWLDDLLEDSDGASKKGSHRRSASDSFTYLENARGLCTFGNIAEVDELEYGNSFVPDKPRQRSSIDTNGLTDLLEEIQQLQDQQNAPISALMQPAMARSEISKVDEMRALAGQKVFVPEAKSMEDADACSHDNNAGDANIDAKKTKRQSAQRSRVRKLQYIAELERIVNALQTQVSSLSPQLLLFRHQRALLSMDNSALKQKIALCMHEKSIKDSQNDTLSKEVRRLQALHELQAYHELQKQQQHRIHRHSSLPSDFEAQLRQYSELNAKSQQSELNASSQDMLSRAMKDLTDLSLDSHLEGIANRLVQFKPDLVKGAANFCVPFAAPPPQYIPMEKYIEFLPNFQYQAFFASPESTAIIDANVERFMSLIYSSAKQYAAKELPPFEKTGVIEAWLKDETKTITPELLSKEELNTMVSEIKAGVGFGAMLNYYRTRQINHEFEKDLPQDLRPDIPKLIVVPAADPAIPAALTSRAEKQLKNVEVVWLEGLCGHWVQLERPQEIEKIVGEWVERFVANEWAV